MKYFIRAKKETSYRTKTIERIVTLNDCETIQEAIQKKFKALDPYLQNFFKYGSPIILECRKL